MDIGGRPLLACAAFAARTGSTWALVLILSLTPVGAANKPLVVALDSDIEVLRYKKSGGKTNAHEIGKKLQGFPIQFEAITTRPDWTGLEDLVKSKPALAIIHINAFSGGPGKPDNGAAKLSKTVQALLSGGSKIIVYTSAFEEVADTGRKFILFDVLKIASSDARNVEVLGVGGVPRSSFDDPSTVYRLKSRVIALLGVRPRMEKPSVLINELMASNSSSLQDGNGDFDDWAEIYNPHDRPVDLGGLYFTDDWSQPTRWQVPSNEPDTTTIPPKGFLLVWFDNEPQEGTLHANFRLSSDGEQLILFAQDGLTVIDSVAFGPQEPDVSFGRQGDGATKWSIQPSSSPGASNKIDIQQ